jgi:sugar lactone lactonase YvrE
MARGRLGALAAVAATVAALLAPASAAPFGVIRSFGGDQLGAPAGIAVDPVGTVYVADRNHRRIAIFSPTGGFLGSRMDGQLSDPEAIALDPAGNLWVADSNNRRIVELDPSGALRGTFTGTQAGATAFSDPEGVAVSLDGTAVYVSDKSNTVQRFSAVPPAYAFQAAVPASQTTFDFPDSLAVDGAGRVIVADRNRNLLKRFDAGLTTLLGQAGGPGGGAGTFSTPHGLAVDRGSDTLWAVDRNNAVVQRWSAGAFAYSGLQFGGPAALPPPADRFGIPKGVAVDPQGRVYVTDETANRVSVWGPIADLGVGGTTGAQTVRAGDVVTVQFQVGNAAGADTAQDVTLATQVPAGVQLLSAAPSQGACAGLSCSLGPIPPGGVATVSLALRPTVAGAPTIGATAATSTFDRTPAAASVSLAVQPAVPGPNPGGGTAGGGGGAGGAPGGAATIALRKATLSGVRWRGDRLRATIVLTGRSGKKGRATVTLSPIGRRGTPVRLSARIGAGSFRARVRLAGRFVPGRYRLTLAAGAAKAAGTLALPGPPVGFVDDAYPTAVQAGPPVASFPAGTKAIFAHFHFLTRPARGKSITVTWSGPPGVGSPVSKPNRASVDAIVKSGQRVPSGRWTATLRVGGVVVRKVTVRVG